MAGKTRTPPHFVRAFGPGVYEGDVLLLPTDNGRDVVAVRLADVAWLLEVLTEFQVDCHMMLQRRAAKGGG